jgi:hypothetical protein
MIRRDYSLPESSEIKLEGLQVSWIHFGTKSLVRTIFIFLRVNVDLRQCRLASIEES